MLMYDSIELNSENALLASQKDDDIDSFELIKSPQNDEE